jgi:Tfp pilus assembly protein PilO
MQIGLIQRDKRMILVLLVVGAVFCFLYFILNPQIKAYIEVKDELAAEQAKLVKARADVASYKDERIRYNRISEKLNQIESSFHYNLMDGTDIVALGLKSAADNVEILSIEPGEVISRDYSLVIPLKITARGNYLNVHAFCTALVNLPNLSEISNLKISAVDDLPGVVDATVALLIFSAKDPEGEAYLNQIRVWSLGRYNIFSPAGAEAPVPELSQRLRIPAPVKEAPGQDQDGAEKNVIESGAEKPVVMGSPGPEDFLQK